MSGKPKKLYWVQAKQPKDGYKSPATGQRTYRHYQRNGGIYTMKQYALDKAAEMERYGAEVTIFIADIEWTELYKSASRH